jgi:hypothetical protein
MKWHIIVETVDAVLEFDITAGTLGEAFIPLMRELDAFHVDPKNVVLITMELKDD